MKGVCFMDLKHHFEIANNTWIVNLSGEIDIYNAPQLKEQLLKLLEEQKGNMLIDCKDLKYIDSTGLGVLISVLKRVKDENGDITISNLKPYIQKIFTITGLDKIFSIEVQE